MGSIDQSKDLCSNNKATPCLSHTPNLEQQTNLHLLRISLARPTMIGFIYHNYFLYFFTVMGVEAIVLTTQWIGPIVSAFSNKFPSLFIYGWICRFYKLESRYVNNAYTLQI